MKTVSDNLIDLFGKVVSFGSHLKSALGVIRVILVFLGLFLVVVRIIAMLLILLLLVLLLLFLLFVSLFALLLLESSPLVLDTLLCDSLLPSLGHICKHLLFLFLSFSP